MPLTDPKKAMLHLYPDITPDQYSFRDRRDETGEDENGVPYVITDIELDYLDPALGPRPTQAELEQAELDYNPPSILSGGDREPGLADIEQDFRAAYDYFRWRVGEKVRSVAKRYGFEEIQRNERGQFVSVGSMEKAAKYSETQGSPWQAIARQLLRWESDVWAYLAQRWQAIDPRGDFTGFDGVTPPTWPQLENDLDTEHPEP